MPMNTDQIIRDVLGRMADQAPPALESHELARPTVQLQEQSPTPTLGRRLAVVGIAAVIAVVALVGVVSTLRTQPDGATPVGAATAATAQELQAALASAFASLEGADGFDGSQEAYVQDHLATKVWFTARANGDTAVVQQVDIDVTETAWWNLAPSPPTTGERIATSAWVHVGDDVYEAGPAGSDATWQISDTEGSGPAAVGLIYFEPGLGEQLRDDLARTDAKVTRQATADRGTIWTATYNDGGQSRFYIHPNGHLATLWWRELSPLQQDRGPIDSGVIHFSPLDDPDPIQPPTPGTALVMADLEFVAEPIDSGT